VLVEIAALDKGQFEVSPPAILSEDASIRVVPKKSKKALEVGQNVKLEVEKLNVSDGNVILFAKLIKV